MKSILLILLFTTSFSFGQKVLTLKTRQIDIASIVAPLNLRIDSLLVLVSTLSDSLVRVKSIGYVEKSNTYTASVNDNVINCISGTFTITVTAATRTKSLQIINTGSGIITVVGSTFMGESSIVIYSGHSVQLQQIPTGYIILNQY